MVPVGLNLSKLVVCLALMAAASSSVSQVTVTVTCFGAYCESCCAVRGKKIEKCLMFSMHFFNDEFGDVTKMFFSADARTSWDSNGLPAHQGIVLPLAILQI